MSSKYSEELKERLEFHYRAFDKTTLSPDPVEFPHRYNADRDIEISAFLSSVFAYGGITQIMKTLASLFAMMGSSPFEYLIRRRKSAYNKDNIYHRFYTTDDIEVLLSTLSDVLINYGSIGNMFTEGYNSSDTNISGSLENFSQKFTTFLADSQSGITHGLKHILPAPSSGSACKRMNLFLRWMVRKDEIDFGIWNNIPPSKLIIPVDVHIARIAAQLGLTKRKNINWKMAEEITSYLSLYDSTDPVKYDFALCHIGMRKMEF